jgi:hypothetical protein
MRGSEAADRKGTELPRHQLTNQVCVDVGGEDGLLARLTMQNRRHIEYRMQLSWLKHTVPLRPFR